MTLDWCSVLSLCGLLSIDIVLPGLGLAQFDNKCQGNLLKQDWLRELESEDGLCSQVREEYARQRNSPEIQSWVCT